MQEEMFCYQCEQTAKGEGCTAFGVCGKSPEVAALQDLLVYKLRGLSALTVGGRDAAVHDEPTDYFICDALFTTLTNVNFDPESIIGYIRKAEELGYALRGRIQSAGGKTDIAGYKELASGSTREEMVKQGRTVGIKADPVTDPDLHGLQWLLTYGVKGVAAYTCHAYRLGKKDDHVFEFVEQALSATLNKALSVDDLIGLVLKCGEINIRAMELLDSGNTDRYGNPVPTSVPLGSRKGKAILVSGHDLKDLESVLEQCEGKGITVYTHGEMLPAHGYPKLKAYPDLYGHYGSAWQNQKTEFQAFPGAILMTTNCLQRPQDNYKGNIFTSGPVGWPGVTKISGSDFSPLIAKALELPGFIEDKPAKQVTVGFARNAVISVAGAVVDEVTRKKIRHFFLVGGCDGAKPGRSYYTEFVEKAPKDTVIFTLACGKFRFFDKDLGRIEGIPRLLDIGQCNDAYSAIKIAEALANAFNAEINELPLSFILSWYEQKAVAILLSLLYLGVRDIRLGPSLPAFITPNVLKVLVEKFNIMPIKTPEEDIKAILGQ